MNKLKYALFAAFALTTIAFAQENSGPSMDTKLGIRAGTNFSDMKGASSSVLGWQAGVSAEFPIKAISMGSKYGLIAMQPELLFASKGGETCFFLTCGYKVSAYYLHLDVPASFKFMFSQNFAIRADVGPNFGFGLFGKRDTPLGSFDTFGKDGYDRFDVGIVYGVALEFLKDFYFGMRSSDSYMDASVSSLFFTLGYNF